MLKDTTYKEKFAILKKWVPSIVEAVKKDLRNEHLKNDMRFVKKYFPHTNIHKLTTQELVDGYLKAIEEEEKAEEIGEFICMRWLLKNTEIYDFFEQQLRSINPEFSEIETIDKQKSLQIVTEAARLFGAPKTYLFSVINSVVFPKEVYDQLRQQAEEKVKVDEQEDKVKIEHTNLESMKKNFELQLARLTDKYEKKLAGLEKKYHADTTALKKQIANLQRKVAG